jgi:CRISPR/Cas system endoribonuclease Cas6 (RAMP superfamily)
MKQVSTRLRFGENQKAILVGTTWEFFFEGNPIIQFALDAGLGELCSMGFGFMNLLNRQCG